jgi:hypothetical protein
MPADKLLIDALREDLRDAWALLQRRHPTECVYAFGLYTTTEASYFCPFACGKQGLREVAERYGCSSRCWQFWLTCGG